MPPAHIYAHARRGGDLVDFHNQTAWHTITGQLWDVDDSEPVNEAGRAAMAAKKRLM
jgi:hypothetical protein